MLDCDIEESKFELQPRYNVHFQTYTLSLIHPPPAIVLLVPPLFFYKNHFGID